MTQPQQASRQQYITGNKWLVTIPVMLAALTAVLDTSIVNVALPNMQASFGSSVDEIDWVITGYLISNVIIIPATGWLSSVVGLKRLYLLAQIVFVGASFLCGISWDLGSLVSFRILQGIGGGALLPVALTILMQVFPPEEIGTATALFGMGATIGPAIGPTLGGWLTDAISWQWIFFVNVPIVAASVFLTQIFIGENRAASAKRASAPIDFPGLATITASLGSLQIVLQYGQKDGWFESPLITSLTALSVVSFALFVLVELRGRHPLINLRIFHDLNFALGSLAGAMIGASLFGAVFLLPLFAGTLLHYTALQIGLLLVPAALTSIVLFPVVGLLANRIDPRWTFALGIGLFAASLIGNGFDTLGTSAATLTWLQVLRGASLPFLFTPISVLALAGLAPKDKADGSSLTNLTRTLGGSIGVAVLGTQLVDRQKFHFERFGESITRFGHAAAERLDALAAAFMARGGSDPVTANHQALAALSQQLAQQAFVAAFEDASLALGIALAFTALLLPFFKVRKPGRYITRVAM